MHPIWFLINTSFRVINKLKAPASLRYMNLNVLWWKALQICIRFIHFWVKIKLETNSAVWEHFLDGITFISFMACIINYSTYHGSFINWVQTHHRHMKLDSCWFSWKKVIHQLKHLNTRQTAHTKCNHLNSFVIVFLLENKQKWFCYNKI